MSIELGPRNPRRENALINETLLPIARSTAIPPTPLSVVTQPVEHFQARAINPYAEDQVTKDLQTNSAAPSSNLTAPDFGIVQIHWPSKNQAERNGIEAHILSASNEDE